MSVGEVEEEVEGSDGSKLSAAPSRLAPRVVTSARHVVLPRSSNTIRDAVLRWLNTGAHIRNAVCSPVARVEIGVRVRLVGVVALIFLLDVAVATAAADDKEAEAAADKDVVADTTRAM
jgi:hypothetical protein